MSEFHHLSRNTLHECLMKVPSVANLKQTQLATPECLEVQTIREYFSGLVAFQRGQEKSEEDTSNEDVAIAREEFLQGVIQETQKRIDLRHPLVCGRINLC